jgi:kynurenine formamidase
MHGWAFSHLDALSHAGFRGVFYNGVPTSSVDTSRGASRLDIAAMRQGIVTRGVLIDIPRLLGRQYLDTGTVVTVADLEAWERRVGVRVQAGDVVLVHTGREARSRAVPGWQVARNAAGLHPAIAAWLRDRGAAALGGDAASDPAPSVVAGVSEPLHQLALVSMGMPLFDNLALEELAAVAARHEQWTFLFVAAPLPLQRGSGSLVNALAVF